MQENSIWEKGAIPAPSMTINCEVPMPTLVCDGIFCVLILEDWQVDLHMASGFPVRAVSHSVNGLDPPDLSDLDDSDEEVNAVLWSLLNPQSGKREGERGGAAHNSHCPQPQSHPHSGA